MLYNIQLFYRLYSKSDGLKPVRCAIKPFYFQSSIVSISVFGILVVMLSTESARHIFVFIRTSFCNTLCIRR